MKINRLIKSALLLGYLLSNCPVTATVAQGEDVSNVLSDGRYRTACGPIAYFVALRAIGIPITLDDAISRCDWHPSQHTSLAKMQEALDAEPGVECVAAEIGAKKLQGLLLNKGLVAILAVNTTNADSKRTGHAVVAIQSRGNEILTIDYPRLARWIPIESLNKEWNGQTLIISRTSPSIVTWLGSSFILFAPILVLAFLSIKAVSVYRQRSQDFSSIWILNSRSRSNDA